MREYAYLLTSFLDEPLYLCEYDVSKDELENIADAIYCELKYNSF